MIMIITSSRAVGRKARNGSNRFHRLLVLATAYLLVRLEQMDAKTTLTFQKLLTPGVAGCG